MRAKMSINRTEMEIITETSNQTSNVFPIVEVNRMSSARRAYRAQTLTRSDMYLFPVQATGVSRGGILKHEQAETVSPLFRPTIAESGMIKKATDNA